MKLVWNFIKSNWIRNAVVAMLLFASFNSYAIVGQKNIDSSIQADEISDTLLISLQELMSKDSSSYLLAQESFMLSLLMTEFDDFYSLTKNLFLLDYNLERNGDLVSQSILRYWLGYYMKSQKLMDNALELWKGLELTLPTFLLPELYLNEAEVLVAIGNYDGAITYFDKLNKLGNIQDSLQWKSYSLEAYAYELQNNYQAEIEVWNKTLVWLNDKNEALWNIEANKRLANAYRNEKNYDQAIIYLNKANDLHESYDPASPDLYQYYVDIALIFELQGKSSRSLAYLKTASKEMRKANNDLSEAEISQRIASIYFDVGKLDQAKEYNDKAIRISDKNDFDELLMRAYYLAYQIDVKLNQHEKALDNYAKYSEIKLRFTIAEKENIRDTYLKQYQIERAEKQYKLIIATEELKDFELEQFKLENEKTEAELLLLKESEKRERDRIEKSNSISQRNQKSIRACSKKQSGYYASQ